MKATKEINQKMRRFDDLSEEEKEKLEEIRPQYNKYKERLDTDKKLFLIPLPNWYLMREAGLLTLENNHKLLKLKKLGKLALMARPISEFRELVKYSTQSLTSNRRSTGNYNYFRPILRKDEILTGHNKRLVQSTAPQIWIEEFETLNISFRQKIGSKSFINSVTAYKKSECQHNTAAYGICNKCGNVRREEMAINEPIDRWIGSQEETILVLRDESLNLERITPLDLRENDIQVDLEYSNSLMIEIADNENLRNRLGIGHRISTFR